MKITKKIIAIIMAVMMLAGICVMTTGCGSKSYVCAVQSGTTGWSFMTGDTNWGFAGFANIGNKCFDNGGLAVADMLNGNSDFVVIDNAPAKSLVASNPGTKLIDIALTTESYGIGVNKNDPELLTKINEILKNKEAEIDAIYAKYENVTDENKESFGGEKIISAEYDASKEQFVIATHAAYAPFEFKLGDSFAGIDMEIGKMIADELGQEFVIVDMEFDSVVTSVGSNGIDVALSGLTIKESRKKALNFSDPYYDEGYQVIICKEDCTLFDNCKTTDDIINVLNGLGK